MPPSNTTGGDRQFSLFEQLDIAENPKKAMRLPLPEADVIYYPAFLNPDTADAFFKALQNELPWQQDSLRMFGKTIPIPRLQSWHGDPECTYTYSGLTMPPNPWTATLTDVRNRCNHVCKTRFNSVLANWYRHGQDSMSLHADDEPELGPNPIIASITLGEARPFIFKHKETKVRHTHVLEHGSLLVMAGATQSHYLHGIAKTVKPIDGRINLTFRRLIVSNSM
ncbi:alpha-ketoglutarate-dependent dioxygenase AlkB [Alteromonas hispanica]|uniref:Alpha-ketoglutarate-dependent dioxygenase AlkB n=1 Tax=Alteromonas hispanica TaxID=315421 RepID=A0A6L9MUX6_9ALTE|nr:alpha-ketoglutarate-dependent dioxygenase AlkB [Alteromonas hispanica]